ncbi:PREDICTED: uncharacterized protein LOC109583264 isoform X1 [Amphimedon queenslandica]|nr:PREDICTED: uncharacterized protein LOC109583264 isoform X1 [Amphimedon queenslandica]|eukprot:XP_019854081.1 PREDICTED: uncharacterized protein LOC109583264 isoform X1 [Amphimedon queenslandica]
MEEGGRMSPLDGRPTLDELARYITVGVKWNLLGVQLKLDDRLLDVIDHDKHSTEDKLCAMFQAWLHEKPEATRRDVIEALKIIKDLDIAEKYEKTWKAEKSVDPPKNIEKSLERCRSQIEKPAENEQDWTKKFYYLKEMFDRHVLPPIMELIRVDDAKRRFRKTLHNNFGCNEEFLKVHRSDLDKIEKVEDFVRFLIDLNFLSYLNFQHLKELAGDDCAAYFSDYEKIYCNVFSEVSLPHIASVFRNNPGLVPGGIFGFPTLKFELKQPKSYPSLQDWITSLHPRLPSHIANIQAGDDGSVTITYTMYPPHNFSFVLSILEESDFVKFLVSNEVTPHLKLCKNEGALNLPLTDHDDGDDSNIKNSTQDSKDTKSPPDSAPLPNQILCPLGIQQFDCPVGPVVQHEGKMSTTKDLIAKLKNPNNKIKVQPALLSFNGLPKSGKTTAVTRFLDYVVESSLDPISKKINRPEEHVGIAAYDLIAVSSAHGNDYKVTEAAQESSFAFGVLSLFQSMEAKERVPLIDTSPIPVKSFDNFELDDHFRYMYSFLQSQNSIPKSAEHSFLQFVPEGIALVNIWDLASSNTVHHLLSALEGYLFNSYLWLFVDLENDLGRLDENFEIPKTGRDGAIFLKQRPRLHYLLRSCWSTRDNHKQRKRVCTMFANHKKTGPGEARDKVSMLKEKVQPIANHIGVSELLEDRIEGINLEQDHKRLHDKFQLILKDEIPFDEIPLSWLFLRSLFYRFKKMFVSKDELMEMAKECGMDECSVDDFCKFFTSFGSIIDLSLVDPDYQHVIVKPVTFLESLDKFFAQQNGAACQDYPTMEYGIVPEKACRKSFKDDWPIFMDALVCLNLATPVTTRFLEMPPNVLLDRKGNYYYIPLCCTGPLIDEPDPFSVHLLTNINTPHFFKQVSFAKQLLDTLPEPVLVPCKSMNQTIIKNLSTDTIITISSHVPAIKLKVDKPNEEVCAFIIQATEKIAKESRIPVKYKFVQFCSKSPVTKVESLPSASYHRLPKIMCKKCRKDPRFDKLLKAWTEALLANEIPDKFKATGEVKIDELSEIAERIRTISPATDNISDIAQVFGVEISTEEDPIGDILMKWNVEKKNAGDFEPRRALAQLIYPTLGEVMAGKAPDEKKAGIRQKYETLAKEIDVYYQFVP